MIETDVLSLAIVQYVQPDPLRPELNPLYRLKCLRPEVADNPKKP